MDSQKNTWGWIVLALGLVIASAIFSWSFFKTKQVTDEITVSGSAKQRITSDQAHWTANFSRSITTDTLKDGYNQMKGDEKTVNTFLTAQGFKNVDISPVFMNQVYNNNQGAPQQYSLTQSIDLKSTNVQKMKSLAKNSAILSDQGVFFAPNPVEYNYTKLPELRVSLLPAAIKDARARAEIIAQSSGKTLGAVKSVTMGVVQVMPADTVTVDDYGSYDVTSIDKDVMITVKVDFALQ